MPSTTTTDNTTTVDPSLHLISQKRAMEKMEYRSAKGFMDFVWRTDGFPRPIRLSLSKSAFIERDIDAWIASQRAVI